MIKLYFGLKQSRKTVIAIITGFVFGFITAFYLIFENSFSYQELQGIPNWFVIVHRHRNSLRFEDKIGQSLLTKEHLPYDNNDKGDDWVARQLAQKVRVLCWVMTTSAHHRTKAEHILATWGRRCNTLLFMSSAYADSSLPVVKLDIPESYQMLWGKTKAAFTYIYKNHKHDYDWVLKTDDDTYVIMENLRYMLYRYNTSEPLYFGCRFKPFVKQGFMSGAGYVLSREAVARFITKGIPDPTKYTPGNSGREDVEIGKCLENVGVVAMDSRDKYQRGKFFPFTPKDIMFPTQSDPEFWYWSHVYYNTTNGMNCCSNLAISFHYVFPKEMYVMEYMIYHLRPFGIQHNDSLNINQAG